MKTSMFRCQVKATFAVWHQAIQPMLVQAVGFKANLIDPFGHKQSFWGKQTYCNENKYVFMLLSQVKATFGDKQT